MPRQTQAIKILTSSNHSANGTNNRYSRKGSWMVGVWLLTFGILLFKTFDGRVEDFHSSTLLMQETLSEWNTESSSIDENQQEETQNVSPIVSTKNGFLKDLPVPIRTPDLNEHPAPKAKATVAHIVSFLDCAGGRTANYKEAMLVLRHSIHQNSIHNANSTSQYSYKMYAFLNSDPNAKNCGRNQEWMRRMGFTPIMVPNPVNVSMIENKQYRETVDKTGVTGSSELIKLYLYTLIDHPIVVHWDIDVIVMQPMDDLFDAMLYEKDSREGQLARSRLMIQQPLYQKLPDRIDAFFTRDIALAKPWENRQVAQGGFLVARPSMEAFETYINIVMAANYSFRCGNEGGWDGLGYGCKMGAMHYQGIVAYFYDHVAPGVGHGVELNTCAWNQIGHATIYTGKKKEWFGTCQQSPIYGGNDTHNRPEYGACHDCRVWPIDKTMTAHYTACGKPWQCKFREQTPEEEANSNINSTTCGLLHRAFSEIREDLEEKIVGVLGPAYRTNRKLESTYHPEYFLGYCQENRKGQITYRGLQTNPQEFEMKQVYGF